MHVYAENNCNLLIFFHFHLDLRHPSVFHKITHLTYSYQFSSVHSLSHVQLFAPHESQHTRPPGVHSNSRLLSRRCHPAISSYVVPFSSCPQSLPASGSFPVSQLFTWGGQSTYFYNLSQFKINMQSLMFFKDILVFFFISWILITLRNLWYLYMGIIIEIL